MGRFGHGVGGLTLGALLACGPGPSVQVGWPGGLEARSLLLAQLEPGLELTALNLGDRYQVFTAELPGEGSSRLVAVTYDRPLESLLLRPGRQAAGPTSGPTPLSVGGEAKAWTLDLETQAWTALEASDLDPRVREFHLDRPQRCAAFDEPPWFERLEFRRVNFVVRIAADRALLGVSLYDQTGMVRLEDLLYEAGPSGLSERPSPLPFGQPSAAFVDGVDLYLGANDGAIWRLDTSQPDAAPLQVRAPGAPRVTALGGGRDPTGRLELLSLDLTGHTQFYRDGAWTPRLELPDPRINMVGWASPGLGFVRSSRPQMVVSVEPNRFREVPVTDAGQLLSLRYIPSLLGTFGGSDSGGLYRYAGGDRWERLAGDDAVGVWIINLDPYGDGLMRLNSTGTLVEYGPDLRPCPPVPALNFVSGGGVAELATGVIVAGHDFPRVVVTYLPRVP